jgi:hypothetical protein
MSTEGDSFHVVFPSASTAVMCGMAIVEEAAQANARRPERPIAVGVGIHAGEAIETSEGYFGAAVNLASRLCAIAQAGEVLVTATVRGITQASVPVAFAPRGRRRLKGIDDPVEVFAVTEGAAAPPTQWWRTRVAAGAAVAGVAVIVAVGAILASVMSGGSGTNPSSSPSPVASPAARSLVVGALPIGEYTAPDFEPPFRFVITDPGWSAYRERPEAVGLLRESEPRGRLDVARIEVLLLDPCFADGPQLPVGSTPDELVSALRNLPHVVTAEPGATRVGGREGFVLDVSIAQNALAACGGFAAGEVALFPVADEPWGAAPEERVRIVAIEVDGATVSFLMSQDDSPAGSVVTPLEAFFEYAQRVVDSVVL